MNKFISLTKLQLKDFISRYVSGLNLRGGNIGKILLIFVAAMLLLPSIQLSQSLYTPVAMLGYPQLLITFMYIAAVMAMLFTALPFIISIFFYSKDITFLSSLPITESTIVFSKLSAIYIYLLAVSGFIFGPALAIYIINSNGSLLLFILGMITFITSPILPLVIATIIILPIMRFISGSKRRNLFSILGSILLLAVIIGLQLALTRFQSDPEGIQQLLAQSDGILNLVGKGFPPSIWITNMVQGSMIDTLLFFGLNILLILILQFLSKVLYRKAMLSFNQQGSIGIKQGSIYYKKRSIGYQLIRRHILIIISNPTFFLNTFLIMIVPILMFGIMYFTGEVSLQTLNSPLLDPYRVFIFAGIISSPAIIGSNSATAITREGKSFWETKILPISLQDNIKYRVITTIMISILGSLILAIVSIILLNFSLIQVLLGIMACVSLTLFLSTIDIIINIYRPMLDWTHPTAAVKNNMNVMISLAIRVALGGLVYLIAIIAKALGSSSLMILFSCIFLVLFFISRYLVYKVFVKMFRDISI
jgi:ABC-2 type transport system permease protein